MEPGTQRLFERVAQKLGWDKPGALDRAAEELSKSLKSRHDAVISSDLEPTREESSFLSDGDGSEKENLHRHTNSHPELLDSSDDDFDQILSAKATPKPPCKQFSSAKKAREPVPVISSDSDEEFEKFLNRVKTPKAQTRPRVQAPVSSDDSLKHFIVDDFSSDDDFVIEQKKPSTSKARPKTPGPGPKPRFDPPVFLSDSDDDADLTKSTWNTRLKGNGPKTTLYVPSPLTGVRSPAPASAPPTQSRWRADPGSSDDEFQSLLDRIRKNQKLGSSSTNASPQPPEPRVGTACVTPSVRAQKDPGGRPGKGSYVSKTPVQVPVSRPISQTEPRAGSRVAVCKIPGCFLTSLSDPTSVYCRGFKHNKEELTGKLYRLYNGSVFESKLPTDMSIKWNAKMRKTAGYCVTGQERANGNRYARIELSVKVCDSADRLRDTLVHEMCHAATWLINNVRDGHGPFWKIYARKATLAHPELPMVTRCHSYDINYKYQYQCNRCKNTVCRGCWSLSRLFNVYKAHSNTLDGASVRLRIGRHSKSLDTQKFVCALCTGQLVLLTPSRPRGPTPFASFVKENYGSVRQELVGQSHADVMRKLSADFASKTRLSQS